MAASEVAICNIGLSRIGERTIESFTERSKAAQVCKQMYDTLRDSVLSEMPWRFAVKTLALAEVADAVNPRYRYVYAKPNDMIRALRFVYDKTGMDSSVADYPKYGSFSIPIEYEVIGEHICSNETPGVLEFISRVTDPTQFPEHFRNALSWRIAAEVAMPIRGDAQLAQYGFQMYEREKNKAHSIESSQARLPREAGNGILRARSGIRGVGSNNEWAALGSGSVIEG